MKKVIVQDGSYDQIAADIICAVKLGILTIVEKDVVFTRMDGLRHCGLVCQFENDKYLKSGYLWLYKNKVGEIMVGIGDEFDDLFYRDRVSNLSSLKPRLINIREEQSSTTISI